MKSFEYIKLTQEKLEKCGLDTYSVIYTINEINGNYTKFDMEFDKKDFDKINQIMEEYIKNYTPVQHQFGYSYFYGRKFNVTKDTLIPRFDTEEVTERAIFEIDSLSGSEIEICDLCSGSGVMGLTCLLESKKQTTCDFYDISNKAMEVCKQNIAKFHLENKANCIVNDLLENITKKYDIIISNPPYIDRVEDVGKDVLKHEPHLALFAKNDGMEFYERILKMAKYNLKDNGIIVFEIGYNQEQRIKDLAKRLYETCSCKVYKDINQNPRIAIIKGVK